MVRLAVFRWFINFGFYELYDYNENRYACSENMAAKRRYDDEDRRSDVSTRCYNDDSSLGVSPPFVAVTLLDQLSR